ncbi:component of SufBCD complex [Nonlabens arenilitoris]|uniref:Component of SufBCD complex n=1 Tax=Nonlabens arenilitoris TaxID=1217969 RepID=A0A2S7U9H8_9FLAO|nr:component of SufBCD complex [Nonlabens arenilitoris]PQJ31585.1 component of SufBCD complex [Nonlabens arenilitoris]
MKRLIVLCFIAIATIACKKQENPVEDVVAPRTSSATFVEDENTFKGEFILLDDAAVLTSKNDIYAVRIDDKLKELHELALPLQKTKFDMVNVIVKGELTPNPLLLETGEGWEQMLIIKEIIEVTPATSAAVVAPIN